MAIGVRSFSAAGNSGSTATAAKPSGTSAGDLLLAFHACDPDGSLAALTAPAGWTLAAQSPPTSMLAKVFWKIAGPSEPSTYVFGTPPTTASDSALKIVTFAGADAVAPISAGPTWAAVEASGKDHVAPSVVAPVAGALVCLFVSQNAGNFTPPTGMSEIADSAPSGWTVSSVCWQQVPAGATGTRESAHSVSQTRLSVSLVLREPAPAGVEVDQAASVSSAAPVSRAKAATVDQPVTVDQPAAVQRSKTVAVGQAVSAAVAGGAVLVPSTVTPVGEARERDRGRALERTKTVAVGQAVSASSARPSRRAKSAAVAEVGEVSSAGALSRSKTVPVSPAVEVLEARALYRPPNLARIDLDCTVSVRAQPGAVAAVAEVAAAGVIRELDAAVWVEALDAEGAVL